jgi:hypothetical protein
MERREDEYFRRGAAAVSESMLASYTVICFNPI